MNWGKKLLANKPKISNERRLEVIRRPLVTEKSTLTSENNALMFEVAADASKPEIKLAVEALFKVKVKKVNTLTQKGKSKRFRGRLGQRSDFKKAVVTLEEGQTVDISTGI